jgi:hypothetical protein
LEPSASDGRVRPFAQSITPALIRADVSAKIQRNYDRLAGRPARGIATLPGNAARSD